MIYLIGGPPKCGKTTLAKSLGGHLGVSWISADTLQNIVKMNASKEDHPKLFPSSHHRTSSNDERFSKYDTKTLVSDYIIQGKTSYPAIEMIVETYLTDEDDFIVEGYQVTPILADKLSKKFGKENIRAIFLVKHNVAKFIEDIRKTSTPNDWVVRRTKDEATFPKIAKMIVEYSDYFEQESKRYNLPVFQMDHNFENQINEAVKALKCGLGSP